VPSGKNQTPGQQGASLVDRTSFQLVRRERIETAFAFDRDLEAQGFATPP
jgi:predicted nucleic acid-binding protein